MILGLKALVYDHNIQAARSPSRTATVWQPHGYYEATCKRSCRQIPGECGCGVYATTSLNILTPYMKRLNSFAMLAVPAGETEVWSAGWRAQACQVAFVAEPEWLDALHQPGQFGQYRLAAMAAAEYFDVDVLPLNVALAMICESWREEGYELASVQQPGCLVQREMCFEKVNDGEKVRASEAR